jgi:hypothetical protein
MTMTYEERVSDSPFVDSIWRMKSETSGSDIISADVCWDMMVIKQHGQTTLSVWGATTKAKSVAYAEDAECLGIRFKLGTFMPELPADGLLNASRMLPQAIDNSFWLNSSAWEYPTYENVETFLNRLVQSGLLGRDAVVEAALQGRPQDMSLRSVQRRFLRITGLTQRYIRSIERAQQAKSLLESGLTILDAVYEAGYADQQHMTTSLKLLQGQTPAQIARLRSHE